ncbi:hypothetical protein [Sphingomonas sp. ATCC 31555]|uniref:hypothetical protein n=2 Tax=unclassified Sphingomonas TaxID=196159 RepID=UPI001ED8C80B|nr:hypothetical protein [Sphingomonas sp. ATCC 31555]
MDMPPSRYRVEERGRRLVVVDRTTGREVSQSKSPLPLAGEVGGGGGRTGRRRVGGDPPPAPPASGRGAQGWRFGIQRPRTTPDSFVTRSWFDAKAPRTIKLNYTAHSRLAALRFGGAILIALLVTGSFLFWPWFPFLIGMVLAPPKMRAHFRAASTRWIDGFDQAD